MRKGTRSIRTLKMLEEIYERLLKGDTLQQIAEDNELSPYMAYYYLGEVAKANGVSRESLLSHPHYDSNSKTYRAHGGTPKNFPSDLDGRIETALSTIQRIQQSIKQTLQIV